MSSGSIWCFERLISKDYLGRFYWNYQIDECMLNLIWTLARKGPLSIYQLGKEKTTYGKKSGSWKLRKYYVPDVASMKLQPANKDRTGEEVTYPYSVVHRKVKELENKFLVEDTKRGLRNSRIIELTFLGLLLYLVGSMDKDKFKNAVIHNRCLLPFSGLWDQMNEAIGKERVAEALDQAVKDCSNLRLALFKVRSIGLEFKALLREDLILKKEPLRAGYVRDPSAVRLVQKEEAQILKNSYLAYLAVHEMLKLAGKHKKEAEELLPHMTFAKELAFIEKRKSIESSILTDRFKEYFTIYVHPAFFLTGMFVNNLLWKKKTDSYVKEPEFEVT
jgi:hypothetical protein